MIRRNRAAAIFLILGLLFMITSIPFSAAINRLTLSRDTDVKLAEDNNAVLKLTGFQNVSYDMDNKYKGFGTITNNTSENLKVTVTVIPDFQIYHFLTKVGVEIGKDSNVFGYHSSAPKQLSVIMAPGEVTEVKAYIFHNLNYPLFIEFQFTATDMAGTFTVSLLNTSNSPRCVYLY